MDFLLSHYVIHRMELYTLDRCCQETKSVLCYSLIWYIYIYIILWLNKQNDVEIVIQMICKIILCYSSQSPIMWNEHIYLHYRKSARFYHLAKHGRDITLSYPFCYIVSALHKTQYRQMPIIKCVLEHCPSSISYRMKNYCIYSEQAIK